MKVVNLLEFLNSTKILQTLNCASCDALEVNVLDLLSEEEQFVQSIDLGLVYVQKTTMENAILVDGIQRILSVSLLLHAICECYKKTSIKNDRAIEYIKSNYLMFGDKMRLRLPHDSQLIYEKIVNGERLSGKEKNNPIFIMLHNMWVQIKEQSLQAGDILTMLNKVVITLVDVEYVSLRDVYISLNKDKRELNQFLLLEDFFVHKNLQKGWEVLKSVFSDKEYDLSSFLRDFFVTKFNFKEYSDQKLYEYFVNYYETMLQYISKEDIVQKIINSAKLYRDLVNVNFEDEEIKRAFIKIKMHKGEDTYAYLLNVYQDYIDENITKATFLEILSTIDEYLQNRLKTPNDVSFNELIKYLNAFITCK